MKKTIGQAGKDTFKGKRVLVRVDFNVPQHEDGTVSDDSRITAALPTINHLTEAGAKVILVSHLGRPKGVTPKYTLKPVADHLQNVLKQTGRQTKVTFVESSVGKPAEDAIAAMKEGEICVLENVRFHPEEEKNDPEFAKQLAKNADVYVNDAFGTAHRAHASTQGISQHLRPALSGMLIDKELRMLNMALENPKRPFATIIGGSKVSSKIGVLENLLKRVDVMVIGGAMAFSFLKARGLNVGKSLVEDDKLEYCRQLEEKAKEKGVKLILPVDVVCASEIKAEAAKVIVPAESMPADQMGLDLGPKTTAAIVEALSACKTILWNGPLGVFEVEGFEKSTYELIDKLVQLTAQGVTTIVGGGDSVAAITQKGVGFEKLTHVGTGGGATLEFLEGIKLPGIECLDEAETAASNR
jgi:phosphoglycerate kinase